MTTKVNREYMPRPNGVYGMDAPEVGMYAGEPGARTEATDQPCPYCQGLMREVVGQAAARIEDVSKSPMVVAELIPRDTHRVFLCYDCRQGFTQLIAS